ncbi:hypothetical protein ACIP1G_18940 [Pseudomonas sp. NPDC089392]|uniref:GapS6b family protein n=1 Tax=Pseudomonas sp. NPDC089392 TaxID=3364459 RepID=UPI0037F10EED
MNTVQQSHSGDGDNVARDKIINEIRSLAPKDLTLLMEMVFESLRQKNLAGAKAQMAMLKTIAQRDQESAALAEVMSIQVGLTEAQDRDKAWVIVAKIIGTATNPILRDVCQAALLQLSHGTKQEDDARALYLEEAAPGIYAKEAFMRYHADEEQLQAALVGFPPEPVLTGIVGGALRLENGSLSLRAADRLNTLYGSYNSKVLLAMATGLCLNPDIADYHLWLHRPEVKDRVDGLRDSVIALLDESGTDGRAHELGCSILKVYHGQECEKLFEALKKNLQHMDPNRSDEIARFKALAGESSILEQADLDMKEACEDPKKRSAWCRRFLESSPHPLEQVGPFFNLANSSELAEWLAKERILSDASEMEEAYIRLAACIYEHNGHSDSLTHRQDISEQMDQFVTRWAEVLPSLNPLSVFDLAERLTAADLPHKALKLTTPLIPSHELWPSHYVLVHMQCLQQAGQNKTFNELLARIRGADRSVPLLSLQSVQAEQTGHTAQAIELSDAMIKLAPESPWPWYRGCYLLDRYGTLEEQRAFHLRIPDSLFERPSREVKGILFFLSRAGSFKRAEGRWVEWMIRAPRKHAVDFVNFHFGLATGRSEPIDVSPSMEQCVDAVQYCHERERLVRLIVEDDHNSSECTLLGSSQVGQLLLSLSPGESENLNMATFKLEERLPPYIACLRIALKLRHQHNDGRDCFVMMQMPSDPAEFIPLLEEKMAEGAERRERLQSMDAIPLYLRGHALYPSDAFKAALNCWSDPKVPKSALSDVGEVEPLAVVLDAYGIGYLAITNLAQCLLDSGITFVLPAATKEALEQFLNEITDDKFMMLGVNEAGRLSRTTASDLKERDAHVIKAVKLILENAKVIQPLVHDAELEMLTIKDGVDATVFDAMQLSVANNIPWFCMDGAFIALHRVNGHPLVNTQAVLHRAMNGSPFEFAQRRHSLVLYALGALPLPVTFQDLYRLSSTHDSLAGLILFKIIEVHGREIFGPEGRLDYLLDFVYLHLLTMFGRESTAIRSRFSPCIAYTSHVFNHGLGLYLELSDECNGEFRLAAAVRHMGRAAQRMSAFGGDYQPFIRDLLDRFMSFTQGRFMDWSIVSQNYRLILQQELAAVGDCGSADGE